jgi:hypothetical protein
MKNDIDIIKNETAAMNNKIDNFMEKQTKINEKNEQDISQIKSDIGKILDLLTNKK